MGTFFRNLTIFLGILGLFLFYMVFTFSVMSKANALTYPYSGSTVTETFTVTYVVDGDTIRVVGNQSGRKFTVRLFGVDTPELYSPKCMKERALALKAKKFVRRFLDVPIKLKIFDIDRYGRVVARVTPLGSDKSIGARLLKKRLAKVWDYYGGQKKPNHC